MLDDAQLLLLLRMDLQRTGNIANDDEYLLHLVKAARESLARQGLRAEDSEDYNQVVVSTAAWLYRKRVNGEAEPKFLRRMRLDLIVSQQAGRT
jgi:hypothetical protein